MTQYGDKFFKAIYQWGKMMKQKEIKYSSFRWQEQIMLISRIRTKKDVKLYLEKFHHLQNQNTVLE